MILLLFTSQVLSLMSSHCSSPSCHSPAHFHTHLPSLSNYTWLPSVVPAGELLLMLLPGTASPQIPHILANFCTFSGVRLHDGFWPWDLRFSGTFSLSPILHTGSPLCLLPQYLGCVYYHLDSALSVKQDQSLSFYNSIFKHLAQCLPHGRCSVDIFFNDGWIE